MESIETLSPMRILQLIFTGFALFLLVFLLLLLALPQEFYGVPSVVMDNTVANEPPVTVTRSFLCENRTETVTMTINRSVYEASKKTHRNLLLFGDQNIAGARYYGAMINDPSQEQIYTDLITRFRQIRAEQNLTDDEYLELMAACIQSIPYRDGGTAPPKYPAELLAEGMGDCDDKSILISGLLAREGYKIALFKFGPEGHMSMGVGSDSFLYKSTGYTYLEGMTPAYVGFPTAHLIKPLESEPLVIPVGNGPKMYHCGNETHYIYTISTRAKADAAALSLRLGQFAQSDRNSTEYPSLAAEEGRYAAVHAYIISHPYDRPGTFAYLQREITAG